MRKSMTYENFLKTKVAEDIKNAGFEITEEKYNKIVNLNTIMHAKLTKYRNRTMRTKVIRERNRDLCYLFGLDHTTAMLTHDATCSDTKSAPKRVQPLLFCATIIECLS